MARVRLLVLLMLMALASPSAAAAPADQVAWPLDFWAPDGERIANLEAALGIDVDAWYRPGPSSIGSAWGTLEEDPGEVTVSTEYDPERLRQEVRIVRQDLGIGNYSLPVDRVEEQVRVDRPSPCDRGDICAPAVTTLTRIVDRVGVTDLPTLVTFSEHHHLRIIVPQGTFDRFGHGSEAARSVAAALGFPVDRVAWDRPVRQELTEGPTRAFGVPGSNEIVCSCLERSWALPGGALGTSELRAVFASGSLIMFSANVVLKEGVTPETSSARAVEAARAAFAIQGLDQWLPFPEGEDHLARLVFSSDHGLAWRVSANGQGPQHSAWGEVYVDAIAGDVVHADFLQTSTGGSVEPMTAQPPLWAVLLVVGVAFVLTRRFDR